MKISSADVRSLLMRLNDEIQGGTGKITAGPMSFAQSLGENLVVGGPIRSEKKMAFAGNIVATSVVPTDESAVPVAADCDPAVTAVSKNQAEAPTLPVAPGVEADSQLKEAKAAASKAVVLDDVPVEKRDHKTTTPSDDLKGKEEIGKNKAVRKGRHARVGSESSAESKAAGVAAPAAQIVRADGVITNLQPVLQPVQVCGSDGVTATKEPLSVTQNVMGSGSRAKQMSTAQDAKTAAMREGSKSKGIAVNADKEDANEDTLQATATDDSHQNSVVPVREKLSSAATSGSASTSIHMPSSSFTASSAVQPAVSAHVLTLTKASSPAEALSNAIQDRSVPELPQTSVQDHRILTATASTIEVGVTSGSHGWLKIRAEITDTGAVKAAIASSSMTGQEMLHRDLPLLSSFLEQERIPVSSLAVHQAEPASGTGTTLSSDGGAAGQSQRESTRNQNQSPRIFTSAQDFVVPDGLLDLHLDDLASTSGGSWLNVRA